MSCPSRNDVGFGAHVEAAWRLTPRVEIVPGAWFDVYTSRPVGSVDPVKCIVFVVGDRPAAAPSIDPRLAVRVQVAPPVSWVSALGLVHSPPSFVLGQLLWIDRRTRHLQLERRRQQRRRVSGCSHPRPELRRRAPAAPVLLVAGRRMGLVHALAVDRRARAPVGGCVRGARVVRSPSRLECCDIARSRQRMARRRALHVLLGIAVYRAARGPRPRADDEAARLLAHGRAAGEAMGRPSLPIARAARAPRARRGTSGL
jgi:hypothetical protein